MHTNNIAVPTGLRLRTGIQITCIGQKVGQERPAPTSTVNLDERGNVVVSGASVHDEQDGFVSRAIGNVKVSRLPTTVITTSGSIDTIEEATVSVKDLDKFVAVQFFEDTPAVLCL